MRRGIFLLMIIVGAISRANSLKWQATTLEETIERGVSSVTLRFRFENPRVTATEILDIRLGCNCSRAEVSDTHISPGTKGEIRVTVNVGDRLDSIDQIIRVSTPSDIYALHAKVHIRDWLRIEPRLLRFPPGSLSAQPVIIVSEGSKIDKILVVRSPEELGVEVSDGGPTSRRELRIYPRRAITTAFSAITIEVLRSDGLSAMANIIVRGG